MWCHHGMPMSTCPVCRPEVPKATVLGTPPWLKGISYDAERDIITLRVALPTAGGEHVVGFECTREQLAALRQALDKADAAAVAASKVIEVASC